MPTSNPLAPSLAPTLSVSFFSNSGRPHSPMDRHWGSLNFGVFVGLFCVRDAERKKKLHANTQKADATLILVENRYVISPLAGERRTRS
ncbi:hypothetical protein CCUS01_10635 [Colletotrichum cuscutae]|uniref:Uncharacterized protein n=1 Tax=Colletotrichum cuscutae TaxID=1209917 RepID=A0AAI9U6P6_9PEZI|nr:hypothetical protein CCUS01_10635 [Colletotrichum cuscutae]